MCLSYFNEELWGTLRKVQLSKKLKSPPLKILITRATPLCLGTQKAKYNYKLHHICILLTLTLTISFQFQNMTKAIFSWNLTRLKLHTNDSEIEIRVHLEYQNVLDFVRKMHFLESIGMIITCPNASF